MHVINKVAIGLCVILLNAVPIRAQHYSKLWGKDGELWKPGSPLKDFSNVAGYRGGTVPFPRRPVKVSIKDFGAVGDGIADDTKALIAAIKACPEQGAIFIPNGKYKITDWIKLSNLKNITILGEDMFETQLIIPLGLEDIHSSPSKTTGNIPTTSYSWGGGFFWFDNAEEVGIENLSFIFPDLPYIDHFKERGYNMMKLSGTNCWVRNVRGYNADSGIYLHGSYMTLTNILLDAFPGRPMTASSVAKNLRAGHHAIDIQGGDHNLVENYEEKVKYIHSLGSENTATWNVWNRCKGPNIEIDHHNNNSGMENNLWTDIDMGKGLGSEGQRNIDKGGYKETFWNLRSTEILPFDSTSAGIKQGIPVFVNANKYIVVGWWLDWPESEKSKQYDSLPWYEHIGNFDDISPKNIYIAQLKKRLNISNMLPEIQITSPVTNSKVTATTITITAMADDRDGSIVKTQLYINDKLVSAKSTAPFKWTIPVTRKKSYKVSVVATDDKGGSSTDTIKFITGDQLTKDGKMIIFAN